VTAYSPLRALGNPATQKLVESLSQAYSCSPQQLALAWLLAKGLIPIPRSTKPENIKANFRSQQIELSADDVAALDAAG